MPGMRRAQPAAVAVCLNGLRPSRAVACDLCRGDTRGWRQNWEGTAASSVRMLTPISKVLPIISVSFHGCLLIMPTYGFVWKSTAGVNSEYNCSK